MPKEGSAEQVIACIFICGREDLGKNTVSVWEATTSTQLSNKELRKE
jgi:hypothetical protein